MRPTHRACWVHASPHPPHTRLPLRSSAYELLDESQAATGASAMDTDVTEEAQQLLLRMEFFLQVSQAAAARCVVDKDG